MTGSSIGSIARYYITSNDQEWEWEAYLFLLLLQIIAWGLLWKLGWVRRRRQEEARHGETLSS